MEITLTVPDDIVTRLQLQDADLSRHLLEQLALDGYAEEKLTERDVMDLLSFADRAELASFFKAHDVRQHYTRADAARPLGLDRGLFIVPDDFNAPLPEDRLAAFEGRD